MDGHLGQFDVLTINETRLDSSIKDYEVGIVGYEIVRKDRNRNGGGVAIYIRNSINYKIRNDLQPEDLEIKNYRDL
jgi:exonuclease III